MKKITCIFVSADGFIHEMIGSVVRVITDSKWSHAAIGLEIDGNNVVVEAAAPKVRISPIDIYDNEENKEYIEIIVTDEQHALMEIEAKNILNTGYWYGLNDCIAGGATDLFGEIIGEKIADQICDGIKTMDCSEVYTRIIRAAFPEFLQQYDADVITPERAYQATKEFFVN